MKIAINTRFLLKDKLEGLGWFTYEIVKRMVEQHPEHEFIFLFDRPYSTEFIFGPNVTPVVLFPPARHPFLFYWWFDFSVTNALKKYQPDVFFSPDGFLSLRSEVKTVLAIHDVVYLHRPEDVSKAAQRYYELFIPKFLQKADRILTVSEFNKKDILTHFDLPASKIDVIYNGCRAIFKPLDIYSQQKIRNQYADGQEYFLYYGAIQPRKNVHRIIAAFDLFKRKTKAPHKLLLAGRFAWQTGEVSDALHAAEYKEDIELLGYIPDEALATIVASAFCVTYPSEFEGFGLPIVEAMNCDVPVITGNITSMPEVAGDAGLFVNPQSREEIADAMQRLYSNPHLYEHLRKAGQKQRQKFCWQRASEQVYALIEDVAPQKKGLTKKAAAIEYF